MQEVYNISENVRKIVVFLNYTIFPQELSISYMAIIYMTTIAVKKDTLEMLKKMQEELDTKSHDETIQKLMVEKKRPRRSLWGAMKDVKEEFKREKDDKVDHYA